MNSKMRFLSDSEMEIVNGGSTASDVLTWITDNLNPYQICYDFGHDVLYPYVWKPIKSLFK